MPWTPEKLRELVESCFDNGHNAFRISGLEIRRNPWSRGATFLVKKDGTELLESEELPTAIDRFLELYRDRRNGSEIG